MGACTLRSMVHFFNIELNCIADINYQIGKKNKWKASLHDEMLACMIYC